MAEAKPRLVAVDGDGRTAAEGSAARQAPPGRRALWGGLVLLVLALGAFGVQTQRAGSLERQVETLSGDLAQARAELAAYDSHLGAIRGAVEQLQARLAELDELVRREPAAAATAAPEPARQGP